MLAQCWSDVADSGLTPKQHYFGLAAHNHLCHHFTSKGGVSEMRLHDHIRPFYLNLITTHN